MPVLDDLEPDKVRAESEAQINQGESKMRKALNEAPPRPFALDASSDVFEKARTGDPAAQFELSRALEYCRSYIVYFGSDNRRRTLDEGLVFAANTAGLTMEEAREVYARCKSFMEGDREQFGTAEEWLKRAAAGGHRDAQLLRADHILSARLLGKQPSPEEVDLAKAVLMDGLKRKDPAVIWQVGGLQSALKGGPEKAGDGQWIWFLAACKSGYDCSQNSEWYQHYCRYDYNCQPPESITDVIQRAFPDRFLEMELLANELLDSINAGALDDLDWQ